MVAKETNSFLQSSRSAPYRKGKFGIIIDSRHTIALINTLPLVICIIRLHIQLVDWPNDILVYGIILSTPVWITRRNRYINQRIITSDNNYEDHRSPEKKQQKNKRDVNIHPRFPGK